MQRAIEGPVTKSSGFVGVMVGFVVAVMGSMGAAIYFHAKGVEDRKAYDVRQRALLKEYVAWNAWRAPAREAYDQLTPQLDEIEKFKLTDTNHANLTEMLSRITDSCEAMKKIPGTGVVGPGSALVSSVGSLEMNYESSVRSMLLPYEPDSTFPRVWAASLLRADEVNSFYDTNHRFMNKRETDELEKRTSALSNAELRRRMIASKSRTTDFRDAHWYRGYMENLFKSQPLVPDGLDLEYARRLP